MIFVRVFPYPSEPTIYPPGTPEKEAVLRERLLEKVQLHHPADARYEGDTLPIQWLREKHAKNHAALQRIFEKIKAAKALKS